MGILVKALRGVWEKAECSKWSFITSHGELAQEFFLQENARFDTLLEIVKATYQIDGHTKVALTFQFLDWMLVPHGKLTPPVDL